MSADLVTAVEALVGTDADADDVLRAVVAEVARQPGIVWAGIGFVEGDRLVAGPGAGTPDAGARTAVPIAYRGQTVGELQVDGVAAAAPLERVAELVAAHVLLGWDTGGEAWEP